MSINNDMENAFMKVVVANEWTTVSMPRLDIDHWIFTLIDASFKVTLGLFALLLFISWMQQCLAYSVLK